MRTANCGYTSAVVDFHSRSLVRKPAHTRSQRETPSCARRFVRFGPTGSIPVARKKSNELGDVLITTHRTVKKRPSVVCGGSRECRLRYDENVILTRCLLIRDKKKKSNCDKITHHYRSLFINACFTRKCVRTKTQFFNVFIRTLSIISLAFHICFLILFYFPDYFTGTSDGSEKKNVCKQVFLFTQTHVFTLITRFTKKKNNIFHSNATYIH